MKLHKTMVALTAAGALALGAIALPATASAVDCPAGTWCFWDHSNRGGNWVFKGNSNDVGSAYNDKASSFQNRGTRNHTWRWDNNCKGNVAMVLSPGTWQNASWWNNDETSSVCD